MDFNEIKRKYGRNAILLKISEGKAEPLKTKIGGKPDLPSDFEWSYYEGTDYEDITANRPLSFLAQINLEEVKPLDTENLLPEKGMLYFFYELMTMEWDSVEGSFKVCYYDGDLFKLKQTELPEDMEEECRLPEIATEILNFQDVPDYSDDDFSAEEFGIDEDDTDDYYDKRFENISDDIRIKLLGYPDLIQGDERCECETLFRGYSEYYKMTEEMKAEVNAHIKDWILLFQFDTIETENYELMFGDSGTIYFYIRKEDLKNRNFDNVKLIMQCY